MEYIYQDLLDSNFIKSPYSYIFVDKDIDQKIINHNVLLLTNSIYTLNLCLDKDIYFTSNKLCVVLINEFNIKNNFSNYDFSLLNFFHEKHGFDSLKTNISFYFIPGIKKVSYEILFLSRWLRLTHPLSN